MTDTQDKQHVSDDHRRDHTPDAVHRRLSAATQHSYLRDFIYGGIDGAVTTFAVVAGVQGAGLTSGIIIILGLANLVADGVSMAISNFIGTRAEQQLLAKARETEMRHIRLYPEGEREEVRQIFARKGFKGDELERIVDVVSSDVKQWVDTMLREELGLSIEIRSHWKAAWATFAAFLSIGALPLLAFVLDELTPVTIHNAFAVSAVLTGLAFFIVGAFKSRFVGESWLRAGLQTLVIGGVAAGLAYGIGAALKGLV